MKLFRDDDLLEDDGPIFGGANRYEERKEKLKRAKEIVSGDSMGTFERDEEVWDMVEKLKDD
jgi:hypothetical protein